MGFVKRMLNKLAELFVLYLFFRGDAIRYLRWKGVKIGKNCSISTNPKNFGSEPWLIELGDNVTVTSGVKFITHDGPSRLFRGESFKNSTLGSVFGNIIIKKNSFVGINSIILPNVLIGPNSIVGTGSVVTKKVPEGKVFAGVPAREICSLEEYISN